MTTRLPLVQHLLNRRTPVDRDWPRFQKRPCSKNKLERDDDSKKNHHALAAESLLQGFRQETTAGRSRQSLGCGIGRAHAAEATNIGLTLRECRKAAIDVRVAGMGAPLFIGTRAAGIEQREAAQRENGHSSLRPHHLFQHRRDSLFWRRSAGCDDSRYVGMPRAEIVAILLCLLFPCDGHRGLHWIMPALPPLSGDRAELAQFRRKRVIRAAEIFATASDRRKSN
jgi:hypothetical protein